MKTPRGFVMIYFIFLIPVLLSASLLVLFSYRLIEVYNTQQTRCRVQALSSNKSYKYSWSTPINKIFPKLIADLIPTKNIQGKCASRMVQEGKQWNPKLVRAK